MKGNSLLILLLLLLLVSCVSSQTPLLKQERYAKMYEEPQTVSILIMPPINKTNNVAAKEYLYTTLYRPLCELGYYVFSPYMMLDVLQQESGYDSERFLDQDLAKFHEYIGADAVLFTIINEWSKGTTNVDTNIEYRLVSTRTNEILFKHVGDIRIEKASDNDGAFVLLAKLIANATTPIVRSARKANNYVLNDMPRGQYSPSHMQDQNWVAKPEKISVTLTP